MDLSKLSDKDLEALSGGDLSKLSDEVLSSLTSAPAEDTTSMAERFGQGLRDPVDAGAQLLEKMTPGSEAINRATGMPEGGLDRQLREREAAYQLARGDKAGKFDMPRLAGNIINPANLLLAARAPQAVGTVGRLLTAGGLGATSAAATTPVTKGEPEDFWKEKGKQALLGGGFGMAAQPVVGALSRLVSPRASMDPQNRLLREEGVEQTIGQSLGGWPNRIEQLATSIPILGDAIGAMRNRSVNQLNTAAINRSQTPLGKRVEGYGNEAVDEAHKNVSAAYDAAKSQLQGLTTDPTFTRDLGQLRQLAQGLTPPFRRKFEKQLNDLVNSRLTPQGSMTAETFKRIDSDLGTEAAQFQGAPAAAAKEYGASIAQLQDLLNQQARRTNPAAADAFNAADTAFANLVRVEKAAGKGSDAGGRFTPAQLNQAVKETDRSARRNQSSRGEALMQDLSTAGSRLGNKVPDSGTATRLALMATALGSGAVSPLIPLALAGGATAYTPALQAALRGAATRRPPGAQAVAGALSRMAPRLAAPSGLTGLELNE